MKRFTNFDELVTLLFLAVIVRNDATFSAEEASCSIVGNCLSKGEQRQLQFESFNCVDKNKQCTDWASRGECDANIAFMHFNCPLSCNLCSAHPTHSNSTHEKEYIDCEDKNEHCADWVSKGQCENNSEYMFSNCAKSCNLCSNVLIHRNSWGENQHYDTSYPNTYDILVQTQDYMLNKVYAEEEFQSVKDDCWNSYSLCAHWASLGECEANPELMTIECAPSCQSCDLLLDYDQCAFDPDAPKIWTTGSLNAMFTRITTEEYYKQFNPVIHSRPSILESNEFSNDEENDEDDPWVITLENFLTDEECDTLIQLGTDRGYVKSFIIDPEIEDSDVLDTHRTSSQTWCVEECYDHTVTKQVLDKMENVTGIPDANTEYLQLLKYEVGEEFKTHHDFIDYLIDKEEGVRIMTVFYYLNDVEAGGGTYFPQLDLTIMPKKGKALIFANVYDDDPDLVDEKMEHWALPIEAGRKYGINVSIHSRDFKGPHARGCTS